MSLSKIPKISKEKIFLDMNINALTGQLIAIFFTFLCSLLYFIIIGKYGNFQKVLSLFSYIMSFFYITVLVLTGINIRHSKLPYNLLSTVLVFIFNLVNYQLMLVTKSNSIYALYYFIAVNPLLILKVPYPTVIKKILVFSPSLFIIIGTFIKFDFLKIKLVKSK